MRRNARHGRQPGSVADADTGAPTLGVAIVSWNVRDLLRRCLEAISRAEAGAPAHVVVVDNGSTDGSVDLLRAEFPAVELIANADNRGFTRGNNQALRALGVLPGEEAVRRSVASVVPTYVLLLNPDTEVDAGALSTLVAYLEDHPRAAAVGPDLRYPDGSRQASRRRFPNLWTGLLESTPLAWHWPDNPAARVYRMDDVPPADSQRVDWVTGAAMLLRSAAVAEVGGLDEGFFMYSEELDLCRRLADAGWETHYCPDARVVHHEGKSSEQVVPARHLYFQRSRVRYFRKHHGRGAAAIVRAFLLAGYAVELALETVKWVVGHRRPMRRARMGAYWHLLRDGLACGTAAAPPARARGEAG